MDHKAEETQKWEPSTIEFIMQNVLTELFHSFYARVDTVFCENECRYWVVLSTDKMPEEGEKIREKESAQSFCAMDDRSCTFLFWLWSGKLEWIF